MRIRPTARIVLLDDQDRVLLFQYEDTAVADPMQPTSRLLWCMPGGGLEADETYEEAALRELWEETGIRATLGPCVWMRERALRFAGEEEPMLFRERYFLVRVPVGEVSLANSLPYELELYRDHRWWALRDLYASTARFAPPALARLLAPIVAGDVPAEPFALDV